MSFGYGSSSGGAYQSLVGPGYSYAVLTSSSADAVEDCRDRHCSAVGECRCSKDYGRSCERRRSKDHRLDYHHHDHCREHSREHRHRRSREPTLSSTDPQRSGEPTVSSTSPRRSSELNKPQRDTVHSRERSGTGGTMQSQRSGNTGPFGSLPSGMLRPKSSLARSAMEISDFEGGSNVKALRATTATRRKSTMRSRGNTYNSVRRKSTSVGSTSSLAGVPPVSIRKKSKEVGNGPARPRGMIQQQSRGTVDLKAKQVVASSDKGKSRRRSLKGAGSSL